MFKIKNILWMGVLALACASCSDDYLTPPHLI